MIRISRNVLLRPLRHASAVVAACFVIASLLLAQPTGATITSMIGFRGVLRSSSGSVVSDGNYSMIFVIYSASSSGSCLYTARGSCGTPTAKTISVTNGFFQTLLGESGDNSLDLTFNTDSFYLELTVNGETMTPRRQLASASQAYNANRLGGLAASSVLQSDADDFVSGLLTYSLPPGGTGIGSGTIWINPGSTSTNRTILGISAATSTTLLSLDSEGDLSILGNFAPYNNNWSSFGAFGSAFTNIFASGTAYLGSVSSTLISGWKNNATDLGAYGFAFRNVYVSGSVTAANIYPTLPNAYDLGGFGGGPLGAAWRNIYASGTLFGGTVSSTLITPWTNNITDLGALGNAFRNIYASGSITGSFIYPTIPNTYDLGAYAAAWRDVYVSGTYIGNALNVRSTSATLFYTDIGGSNNERGAATIQYFATQTPTSAFDIGLSVYSSSSAANGAQSYQPRALDVEQSYGGVVGSASVNVTGLSSFAIARSGIAGSLNLLQGMVGTSQLLTPVYVSSTLGGSFSLSVGAAGAGSVVSTGTALRAFANPGVAVTYNRLLGVHGQAYPTSGGIPFSAGLFGEAGYASNSFSAYLTGAPTWIDADYSPDISNHGASNTPGALFVGGITELNSNVFVDGPFQASSTAMFSLGATSSHIYPWTNNAHDLGAYGNAWRDLYTSGTVTSASHYPWQSNAFDLGLYGASWRNIYASGTLFGGTVSSTLITPWTNNITDLGALGNAFRNIYASGSVTSGTHYPTSNATYDLGGFGGGPLGAAWRNLYTSGTIFAGTVSSTLITPWSNNTTDLGASGNAFRNIYASGSVTAANIYPTLPNTYDLGSYAAAWRDIYASGSVTAASIRPWSNNAHDIGAYGAAWRDVYVSGSVTASYIHSGFLTPSLNNSFDLGAYGFAWRNLYSSGTAYLGNINASSTTTSTFNQGLEISGIGSVRIGGNVYPSANTTYDLGAFGSAWSGLYVSGTSFMGSLRTTNILPHINNLYDLGAFNLANRNLYVSGTLFGGTVSSTLITGYSNNSMDIGALGNAIRNVYASGSVTSGSHYPTANALYDLGEFGGGPLGAAWRNLYTSGTIFAGTVSSTLITPWTNNSTDLGAPGNAFRNIYASGSVTSGSLYPTRDNFFDLGAFGAAWKSLFVSSTARINSVSATIITPWKSDTFDLGAPGNAWRSLYASTSLVLSGGSTGFTLTTGALIPVSPNSFTIGTSAAPLSHIFSSGTLYVGSTTASSTFTSATITLGNVGYDLPNFIFTSTGTFRASPADVAGNAAFVFDTSNNLTALGPTSTALFVLRENATDRLSIVATSSEMVVVRSFVASNTVTMAKAVAFALETVNYIPSSTNGIGDSNILLSVRNQNGPAESSAGIDPEFAVYAGGNVVADGSFTSNGSPGDVAEYVEVAGEPVSPGDVLVVDDIIDGTYRKSSAAYAKDVAGVVATTPKFIIGAPNGTNAPLVLAGLAQVNATDENGPISRGDLLVSSSRSGYAMRYDPATDTGSRLVAVLGVALEPHVAGNGRIQTLVRSAWVNNVAPSVKKISRDLLRIANTIGVRIDPIVPDSELSVRYGSDGDLASGVSRDLAGASIVGVSDIQGAGGQWHITSDGTLIAYVATSRGTQKPYYALGSPDVEFVISGTGRLENGEALVEFEPDVRDTLDERALPKVVVTPLAPIALYVTDKSSVGFHVKSLAAGAMDAEFDWIAIVRRKGYGEELAPSQTNDTSGVADVSLRSEPLATTSTPATPLPSDVTTTTPLDVLPASE